MKMSGVISVLLLIGQLMNLANAPALELPSPGVHILKVHHLHLLSKCEGRLSPDSQRSLERLILKEKKQLIYLKLNSTLFNDTKANVSEILFPLTWVWVTDNSGLHLLELDFRYAAYSLGTLSLDVGETDINIEIQNEGEILDYRELLSVVSCSIQDALIPMINDSFHTQSSICHSQLSLYGGIIYTYGGIIYTTYIVQYKCCAISSHKYNIEEGQRSNQTCHLVEKQFENTFSYLIYFLLFLFCPLLIKTLVHVEHITSIPNATCDIQSDPKEDRSMLYVIYNSSTPLSHLLQSLLQLCPEDCIHVYRFSRFCFFVFLFPSVIYLMIGMDASMYSNIIRDLIDVEKTLDHRSMILDVYEWDHFWLMTSRVYYFAPTLIVFIILIIVSFQKGCLAFDLKTLTENNEYFGFIKLPQNLCPQNETSSGFLKLYQKMIYRFSLFFKRKFWAFWLKEAFQTFLKPDSCRSFCSGLRKLISCLFSLLCLFPVFNLLPNPRGKKITVKAWLLFIFMCVYFCVTIVPKYCEVLTMFILYTVNGTVKQYHQTLPVLTIILAVLYYIWGTIHTLEGKYMNKKKAIFEDIIAQQKENDEGETPENTNFKLVVYNDDGTPIIPKIVYDHFNETHFPLIESLMYALFELFLISIFIFYVPFNVDVFQISNATAAGPLIARFLLLLLPKLFEFFHGNDEIEVDRNRKKLREAIKKFVAHPEAVLTSSELRKVITNSGHPDQHEENVPLIAQPEESSTSSELQEVITNGGHPDQHERADQLIVQPEEASTPSELQEVITNSGHPDQHEENVPLIAQPEESSTSSELQEVITNGGHPDQHERADQLIVQPEEASTPSELQEVITNSGHPDQHEENVPLIVLMEEAVTTTKFEELHINRKIELQQKERLNQEKRDKEKKEKEQKDKERAEEAKKIAEELERLKKISEAEKKPVESPSSYCMLPVGGVRKLDRNTKCLNHIEGTSQWDLPQSTTTTSSSSPAHSKVYKTKLREENDTPRSGGLMRSHYSPNIAQLVKDGENASKPMFNRRAKPTVKKDIQSGKAKWELSKQAYKIRQELKLQTRIKLYGIQNKLEVRKTKDDRWMEYKE